MRGMCIGGSKFQRPARVQLAGGQAARFGMGPAEGGREPPIVAIVPGETLAKRKAGRVMVGAPAKGVEAEGPEGERERERIPRPFFEMQVQGVERFRRSALDRQAEDFDVRALALRDGGGGA